ncbi:tight adherence protein E [Frankia sp. AgKG'84/4]
MPLRRGSERPVDRGYASVELAALIPVIGLLIVALIAAGRYGVAREQVQQAAREAARAAALARSPAAAETAARAAAAGSLADSTWSCPHFTLTLDAAGLTVPVGQPGQVRVTIACQVPLQDLAGLPLPGQDTLSASFSAPVDQFRGR